MQKFFSAVLCTVLFSVSSAFAQVGPLDKLTSFGYVDSLLKYVPTFFGPNKEVFVKETIDSFGFKCAAKIKDSSHHLTVEVTAAVSVTKSFEKDFDRLVAKYGKNNVVSKQDVHQGALVRIGEWQETLCEEASKKGVLELLKSPSLGFATALNTLVKDNEMDFEIKVQTVNAIIPKEYLEEVALRALKKIDDAKKAPVKPAARVTSVQAQCCCVVLVSALLQAPTSCGK